MTSLSAAIQPVDKINPPDGGNCILIRDSAVRAGNISFSTYPPSRIESPALAVQRTKQTRANFLREALSITDQASEPLHDFAPTLAGRALTSTSLLPTKTAGRALVTLKCKLIVFRQRF